MEINENNLTELKSSDFPTFGAYSRWIESLTPAERETRRAAKNDRRKAREAADRAARIEREEKAAADEAELAELDANATETDLLVGVFGPVR